MANVVKDKAVLKIATLFSGIGAPEQAAKRVWTQHKIVFACEIDKFARQSYLANYDITEEHFHEDVKDLDGIQYRGKVDLLVWGFPCQDYSLAGKRAGLAGQRGTLFYEGARITKEVQPRWFLAENVKGLLSSHNGRDFDVIMDILRNDVGYYCTWAVLNTKDYGVPQNRERVFIVGFRDYDKYMRFEFPKPIPLEKKLKDVLEANIDEKYYLSEKAVERFLSHTERMRKKWNGFRFKPTDGSEIALDVTTRDGGRPTDNFIIEPKILQRARGYNDGGEHSVSPTISSNSWHENNLLSHDCSIRKLTPRECLRLQDFPDDFKQVVSDSQMYKQAGNSMSVNVIEAIFQQLKKVSSKEPTNTLLDFAMDAS